MRKNVSLLSFCRKDLFQVAFKCFCSFKAEKQFIPQIGELEDCATFEKKCFHAIILQKKLLLSPFQMLLFLNSKKKQFIPQISSQNLYMFWVCVLRKKCKPKFTQKLTPLQSVYFLRQHKHNHFFEQKELKGKIIYFLRWLKMVTKLQLFMNYYESCFQATQRHRCSCFFSEVKVTLHYSILTPRFTKP